MLQCCASIVGPEQAPYSAEHIVIQSQSALARHQCAVGLREQRCYVLREIPAGGAGTLYALTEGREDVIRV